MEASSVKRTLHLPDSFLRETFVCGSGDDEWVHLCQGKKGVTYWVMIYHKANTAPTQEGFNLCLTDRDINQL